MIAPQISLQGKQGVGRVPGALGAPHSIRSLHRRCIAPQAQLDSGNEQTGQDVGDAGANNEPGPPPPRRRSPAVQQPEVDEPEERDLFIPIMVVLALAGYATAALIAWVEYQSY